MSKIFFSADDYGLTKGLSDTLYEKVLKYPSLRKISAVPNGYNFKESIDRLKRINGIKITCHLNIVECPPLSKISSVPLLVDKNGHLDNTFAKIMRVLLFASRKKRRRYFLQIYREVYTQANYFKKTVLPKEMEINSHSHIHLILPVLRMLAKISVRTGISAIRLPREIFYLNLCSFSSLKNFLTPNLIKFFITKVMVNSGKNYLRESNLKDAFSENGYFIGVYYTKNMNLKIVKGCVKKILTRDRYCESIEILLHPGRLSSYDIERHTLNPGTKKYYLTKTHADEEDILINSNTVIGMGA